jgi:uncharacterized protein (DUF1330 family)
MKKKLSKEEKRAILHEKINQTKMVLVKFAQNENKKEKVKKTIPVGYQVRRFGAVVGWGIFLSFGLYACSGIGKHATEAKQTIATKAPVVQQMEKENPATSQAAVQFAQDFVVAYFTWGTGNDAKQNRQNQLSKFLAQGLDPEAGVNMDSIKNTSTFKSAEVKNVKDDGPNKAKITFSVTYALADPNAPQSAPKQATKAIVVPVQYDGQTYGIYQLPSFTTLPDKTTLEAKADLKMKKVSDTSTVEGIANFLNTFFKSYSQDGKDQLSYFLLDKENQKGLQKSMNFIRVNNNTVYQGKSKDQYLVYCDVEMEDPDSQSQFITTYLLTVQKQGGNYVVTKIN